MPPVVRRAVLDDAAGIQAVEAESFAAPRSTASIVRELENTALARYLVLAEEDEYIQGYAGYWKAADEGQVIDIAVRCAMRYQGYGESLTRAMTEQAFAEGCVSMFLEVRVSNVPAQRLYHKLGYKIIAVRRSYYTAPEEDAYIMECKSIDYIKDDAACIH